MSDEPEAPVFDETGEGERALSIPPELPVLPLRDTVLFPNSFMPLAVARESSVRLIDDAINGGKLIAVFTQRDACGRGAGPVRSVRHRHGHAHPQDVQAARRQPALDRPRARAIAAWTRSWPSSRICAPPVSTAPEQVNEDDKLEIDALQRNIKTNFQQVVSLSPLLSDDLQTLALNISDPGKLADFIASSLTTIVTAVKQEVLETLDVRARMDLLNRILIKELEVLELGSKIQSQVQSEVGKNQRDYFLREQLKAIQKELGEGDDQTKEIEELRAKIDAAGMPEPVKKEALRELDRLSKMPVAAAEYTVSRTYLDWLVALPWIKRTEEIIDLKHTKEVLDADHSDLVKAKDRILEYLAVRKLNPDVKGPILCFLGPPAWVRRRSPSRSRVPSTASSFASRSAACVTRPRSVGTGAPYIGALPGQIIQGLRRAESKNPVFILDEIDKLGSDFRGDPASALLEVLDPEQNNTFRDHYLDVPFEPVGSPLHHDSQCPRSGPAGVARPHGSARTSRLHRRREAQDRAGTHLVDKQVKNHGLASESITFTEAGPRGSHPRLHAGGRRPEPRAGNRGALRKAARRRGRGRSRSGHRHARIRRRDAAVRRSSSTRRWKSGPRTRAWPLAWRGRPQAARSCSSRRVG